MSAPMKYLDLDQAARLLGISSNELNRLREKGEIRAFADRGTWKFKVEHLEELKRRREEDSSPDVQLEDEPAPRGRTSAGPRRGADDPNETAIAGDEDALSQQPTVIRKSKPALDDSDSDVRIIEDRSAKGGKTAPKTAKLDDSDSDVRLISDPAPSRMSGGKLKPQPAVEDSASDVDLFDFDSSESDVKLVSKSGMHKDIIPPKSAMNLNRPAIGGDRKSDPQLAGKSDLKLSGKSGPKLPPKPASASVHESALDDDDFELGATTDSDVKLVSSSGIHNPLGKFDPGKSSPRLHDQSSSEIRLSAPQSPAGKAGGKSGRSDERDHDSDSDVKLEVEEDSDSDVQLVPTSSSIISKGRDSGKKPAGSRKPLDLDDSDSDVQIAPLGGQASIFEDSSSDVRLAEPEAPRRSSSSSARLVTGRGGSGASKPGDKSSAKGPAAGKKGSETGKSETGKSEMGKTVNLSDNESEFSFPLKDDPTGDEETVDLPSSGSGSIFDEESSLIGMGESGLNLGSLSGISLERPNDSGISLEDSVSTEGGGESGIALFAEEPRPPSKPAKPGSSSKLTGRGEAAGKPGAGGKSGILGKKPGGSSVVKKGAGDSATSLTGEGDSGISLAGVGDGDSGISLAGDAESGISLMGGSDTNLGGADSGISLDLGSDIGLDVPAQTGSIAESGISLVPPGEAVLPDSGIVVPGSGKIKGGSGVSKKGKGSGVVKKGSDIQKRGAAESPTIADQPLDLSATMPMVDTPLSQSKNLDDDLGATQLEVPLFDENATEEDELHASFDFPEESEDLDQTNVIAFDDEQDVDTYGATMVKKRGEDEDDDNVISLDDEEGVDTYGATMVKKRGQEDDEDEDLVISLDDEPDVDQYGATMVKKRRNGPITSDDEDLIDDELFDTGEEQLGEEEEALVEDTGEFGEESYEEAYDEDAADIEVSDEGLGEDDELGELEVFGAEEEDFADVESGGSSTNLARPPAPVIMHAVEQDWGVGTFIGLSLSSMVMVLCCCVMFDLVRNMWFADAAKTNPVSSQLLDMLRNMFS